MTEPENRSYIETISYDDYLKLKGLKQLADNLKANLNQVKIALENILQEQPDQYGYKYIAEENFIYGDDIPVENILIKLEIEIEPPPQ